MITIIVNNSTCIERSIKIEREKHNQFTEFGEKENNLKIMTDLLVTSNFAF